MGLYESETFDVIQRRMLGRVSAKVDKREGAILYDSTAPAAVELQNAYIVIDTVNDETFADTASRENLIRRAAERGVKPYPASHAIVKGEFTPSTVDVLGKRFSHEDFNYVVTERLNDGFYKLQCETIGSSPNGQTGRLIPVDYIPNIQTANIVELLVPGEDEEDTESLRARYFSSLKSESYGGNKQDYMDKVLAYPGVGGCKIYSGSEWNGGGTVKIVVQDGEMGVPSDNFISEMQEDFDPEANSGEGKGIAPIGHFVTILPVNMTTVNIEVTLDYKTGYSWVKVGQNVKAAIEEYLDSLNRRWRHNDHIVVRIAHLESAILDIEGVQDIISASINGEETNLPVDKDSLVTLGVVNGN